MHACEVHICETYNTFVNVSTPVKCTPARCTSGRCTFVKCTPIKCTPVRHTLININQGNVLWWGGLVHSVALPPAAAAAAMLVAVDGCSPSNAESCRLS